MVMLPCGWERGTAAQMDSVSPFRSVIRAATAARRRTIPIVKPAGTLPLEGDRHEANMIRTEADGEWNDTNPTDPDPWADDATYRPISAIDENKREERT